MSVSCNFAFVADFFVDDLTGGAELTLDVVMRSLADDAEVVRFKSSELTPDVLDEVEDSSPGVIWVLGNTTLLPVETYHRMIERRSRYVIFEFDYKFCERRSPDLCNRAAGRPDDPTALCGCVERFDMSASAIATFYARASGVVFMSRRQRERYHRVFPFLDVKNTSWVSSSLFSPTQIARLLDLRETRREGVVDRWLVLDSRSPIKGTRQAIKYCEQNDMPYDLVGGLGYDEFLEELARRKGLVYMPTGGDTCPRLLIEAKILGLDIVTNRYVEHVDEPWFATDELRDVCGHLVEMHDRVRNFLLALSATEQLYRRSPSPSRDPAGEVGVFVVSSEPLSDLDTECDQLVAVELAEGPTGSAVVIERDDPVVVDGRRVDRLTVSTADEWRACSIGLNTCVTRTALAAYPYSWISSRSALNDVVDGLVVNDMRCNVISIPTFFVDEDGRMSIDAKAHSPTSISLNTGELTIGGPGYVVNIEEARGRPAPSAPLVHVDFDVKSDDDARRFVEQLTTSAYIVVSRERPPARIEGVTVRVPSDDDELQFDVDVQLDLSHAVRLS